MSALWHTSKTIVGLMPTLDSCAHTASEGRVYFARANSKPNQGEIGRPAGGEMRI